MFLCFERRALYSVNQQMFLGKHCHCKSLPGIDDCIGINCTCFDPICKPTCAYSVPKKTLGARRCVFTHLCKLTIDDVGRSNMRDVQIATRFTVQLVFLFRPGFTFSFVSEAKMIAVCASEIIPSDQFANVGIVLQCFVYFFEGSVNHTPEIILEAPLLVQFPHGFLVLHQPAIFVVNVILHCAILSRQVNSRAFLRGHNPILAQVFHSAALIFCWNRQHQRLPHTLDHPAPRHYHVPPQQTPTAANRRRRPPHAGCPGRDALGHMAFMMS